MNWRHQQLTDAVEILNEFFKESAMVTFKTSSTNGNYTIFFVSKKAFPIMLARVDWKQGYHDVKLTIYPELYWLMNHYEMYLLTNFFRGDLSKLRLAEDNLPRIRNAWLIKNQAGEYFKGKGLWVTDKQAANFYGRADIKRGLPKFIKDGVGLSLVEEKLPVAHPATEEQLITLGLELLLNEQDDFINNSEYAHYLSYEIMKIFNLNNMKEVHEFLITWRHKEMR